MCHDVITDSDKATCQVLETHNPLAKEKYLDPSVKRNNEARTCVADINKDRQGERCA